MTPPTVVVDCRWLDFTGAGRVVQLLLRGFKICPPPGRWVLWGPAAVEEYAWPGAEIEIVESRPNAFRGQRDWTRIPSGDLVVFMHQQRPLRRVPALTMILDTTPIQFPNSRVDGWAKKAFLKRAADSSLGVLTISEYSRRCIETELGVRPDKIDVIDLPADRELAERVLAFREGQVAGRDVALYLGLFLPHKNLPRLIAAFGRTSFRLGGGRLLLVGGKAGAPRLAASLDHDQRSYVDIRARCTEGEVEQLLASSLLLVQPSLVEGFGLPVWEALASGLPACVSDGGALPEITRGLAEHFPATSVDAMTVAIDRCARQARLMTPDDGRALSARLLDQAPTLAGFAAQFESVVDRHLHRLAA